MTQDSLEERIEGLAESYRCLFESTQSAAKQNKFASIDDFVSATRYKTESVDFSRAEYYGFAFNKLRDQDGRIKTFPPMHFTSTLEKNTSFVDIGSGPILLIDLYQGMILEELGRLHLMNAPPVEGAAMGLRLLAEHYIAAHKETVATYVAICRSVLVKGIKPNGATPTVDPGEIERCANIQEVFVLTHEAGHLLWFRKQQPEWFIPMAIEWIVRDHVMMVKSIQERGAPISGPYSPDHLKATLDRRCDPVGGFLEEVYADFYAWTSCMRLFFGNWSAAEVYRGMSLAMRNIAMLDAIRRLAERATDVQTTDDASSRRGILRLGLRRLFGDWRENDDWRKALRAAEPRVTETDLNVDFAQIGIDTDAHYKEKIWEPLFAYALPIMMQIPDEGRRLRLHKRCQKEFGETPALSILRDSPINAEHAKRIFVESM